MDNQQAPPGEQGSYYFENPVEDIICRDPLQLTAAFERLDLLRQQGLYLAGFVSYEAGHYLAMDTHALGVPLGDFPLLHMQAFSARMCLTQAEVHDLLQQKKRPGDHDCFAYNLGLNTSDTAYQARVASIQQHLQCGNTYEVNYTVKYQFQWEGDLVAYYEQLRERQRVAYGGLLCFKDYQILSFSPELFFEKQGEVLTAMPMKGTMPRSSDPVLDAQYKKALSTDPKLIAENIIIVDLLRNDLSRLSYPGSVKVSNLLDVSTFETVHQMTSTIQSRILVETPLLTLFHHLFPCGSITGAPKRKTMQIIADCEATPRRVYTGAIGHVTPQNDMCFNVAIRTLLMHNGVGELGVGGAIVHDSRVEEEWEELKLKARFLTEMTPGFQLLETMKYEKTSGYVLYEAHLARLKQSATVFHFAYDEDNIRQQLAAVTAHFIENCPYKVRLVLHKTGAIAIDYTKLKDDQTLWQVTLHTRERVNSKQILWQHKTTQSAVRRFFERALAATAYDDVIFMNEAGFITESSRANVFIAQKGKLLTPPVEAGLLAGTYRQHLLTTNPLAEEVYLRPRDLEEADCIWLTNAVWGMKRVVFVPKNVDIPVIFQHATISSLTK